MERILSKAKEGRGEGAVKHKNLEKILMKISH